MTQSPTPSADHKNETPCFANFSRLVDYSFMSKLKADPAATGDGQDHVPRQVSSGHYVPVTPTPIADPEYISHSSLLFEEIGLSEELVQDPHFCQIFSGDLSANLPPLKATGWATGYALSIYGTEYIRQCPFGTGNGYGDGRAISALEVVSPKTGKRWEMQLKGGGPTPYCRGADGRAVLRSSVREFLAQEFMHALGVPTSRSLTLFVSKSETVSRPWYSPGSRSFEPNVMVENPVAISTRVAPSFLRVGQIELFARRARAQAHPEAMNELQMIVTHAMEREYGGEIDKSLPFPEQVIALARLFQRRLIEMVGHWLRVGYCQGNFNSDNCAVGGFTLDYGPFGFMGEFDQRFQPWTGGGEHFSFFNQPSAGAANFEMFWNALQHLIPKGGAAEKEFDAVREEFAPAMNKHVQSIFASKLGLRHFEGELFSNLVNLMSSSKVDFTIFFRELSQLPDDASGLARSFAEAPTAELREKWNTWIAAWRSSLSQQHGGELNHVAEQMRETNPKYTWREWLVAPAYEKAAQGDYSLVHELQHVFSDPYGEQTPEIEAKYDQPLPSEMRDLGGICHYSCSS